MTESQAKDFACQAAALAIKMERLRKGLLDSQCDLPWRTWARLFLGLYLRVLWLSVKDLWRARRLIRAAGQYDPAWSRTAMHVLSERLEDCKPFELSIREGRSEE